MLTVYGYKACGSCKKAEVWLALKGIKAEVKPIRETPPSMDELRYMLEKLGSTKKMFNTSGQTYRQLGLKDLLPNLSSEEQLEMMHAEGNLVKRPFAIDQEAGVALVGFKEEVWVAALA